MSPGRMSLIDALLLRATIYRAAKVGAIVGTLLILLNHGDAILQGQFPAWWKVVLTYLVPYSVSSYSTAVLMHDLSVAGLPPERTI